MKKLVYLLTILLLMNGCYKDEDLLKTAILDDPSAMIVFCQRAPADTLRKVSYEYSNNNLIAETIFNNGEIIDKTTFDYNSDNQLIFETYVTNLQVVEKSYIYNELNQLINIKYKFTDYNADGQISNESESDAPREYQNNQLVKEWESWGGFNTYEYKNGKVVTKINYTKSGEKHHFTYYTYSGDLLIEEKKETNVGGLMYLKTYTYDSQNRLIQIRDRENIIEENDYNDKKLIEKRTYYFGIDPGFDVCYGNYIYRYEY
ncbi:hypothetical protein [Algoriphagus sp. Y33]|uniref:hypothetical protein n=1 Tax=Algoriphagus sp. Y33 TaxID=2772483 RepID=UPI00177CCADA|nr:hypothetical protein [Algoriphagus sp. Y33]